MKTVLFVGNSFIYYNDLPAMVQTLSQGKLLCHSVTKGGAFAHQYADPDHELGIRLRQTLGEKWDCVVFQDQSFNPVKDPADCLQAMKVLSALTDADTYFYQTWAYKDGSEKLARTGLDYNRLQEGLRRTYTEAAKDGVLVPVGDAFRLAKEQYPGIELYNADCYHPSPAGTYLAACVFVAVLCGTDPMTLSDIPGVTDCKKLRHVAQTVLEER